MIGAALLGSAAILTTAAVIWLAFILTLLTPPSGAPSTFLILAGAAIVARHLLARKAHTS